MSDINRIYIFGASGSGTTTLASDLSKVLNYRHFDADSYFWLPTTPPFQQKRELRERMDLIRKDLTSHESWILSGSMTGWGDEFTSMLDLAVYLRIPKELRIQRLTLREGKTFGEQEIKPGGKWHAHFTDFIEWASGYDEGGLDMRSKALHEEWMKTFICPILIIEGDVSREDRVNRVLCRISNKN